MHYGFVIPSSDLRACPELAAAAEAAGWDGVFIPDCIAIDTPTVPPHPTYDPWIVLAAMALRTQRVRLGTVLTALPRRRPWKLARETVTLDHLSNGRLILTAGIGAAQDDAGFYRVGEVMDAKIRAQMLDEGLDVLAGLWSGQRFSYHGEHYQVEHMTLVPVPVQSPRIPIWVPVNGFKKGPMRRAARWDGIYTAGLTPAEVQQLKNAIAELRATPSPLDLIYEGETSGDDPEQAQAKVQPLAEAGVTWWVESMWTAPDGLESVRRRIEQGPPRLSAL
jgi:alkanesulfonate monooxygenase SsuD/methylene tetrahydromethanopterin reductase-like flavin-dependent oxidoreductase (luciferase family)